MGSLTILGSIGVSNSKMLFDVPAMSLCNIGGINGEFVLLDNSSKMLNI